MSYMESNMDWTRFEFNYCLDTQGLLTGVVSIEAYKEAALNLLLPPDWRNQLDRLNRVRAVYGTTALEGNPLSEAEVSRQMEIVETGSVRDDRHKISREQLQIRNAGKAQAWVKQRFYPNSPPLTLGDILLMHKMITDHSDVTNNVPGELRTFSVQVGAPDMGGVHVGAPYDKLEQLMNDYVTFITSRRLLAEHPVIRALLAHFFLVTIHPCGDGNGRVSRLLEAGILLQSGYNVHGFYGLSNYFYRNEREYKTLLQECRKTQPFDVTPFIRFGIDGFATELKGINNFIKAKLNRVVYRAMLVRAFNLRKSVRRRFLNQREYSLLDFLLTETEPTDPFSDEPSRKIKLSELRQAKYVLAAYKGVQPRSFFRELTRLGQLHFIKFSRDEAAKDWIVELDFEAIGRY